jgi:hypothetical protein
MDVLLNISNLELTNLLVMTLEKEEENTKRIRRQEGTK